MQNKQKLTPSALLTLLTQPKPLKQQPQHKPLKQKKLLSKPQRLRLTLKRPNK